MDGRWQETMHLMFVKLFLADDGDDPPTEERHRPHLANRARRNRSRMAAAATRWGASLGRRTISG